MIPDSAELFYIKVNGRDDRGRDFQRYSSTAIGPEDESRPNAFMQEITQASSAFLCRIKSHFLQAVIMSSVNLTCQIDSRAPFQLYWTKGPRHEVIGGPLFFKHSEAAIWTLHEVTESDQGEYHCEVISNAGNVTRTTMLTTREPRPHIIAKTNVTVPAGQQANLHCRTQSPTTAAFTWERARIPVQNNEHTRVYSNGTLSILRATKADEGAYTCSVVTRGGSDQKTIMLYVLG